MRIGIFFGGISREREVSFAGGKTASENLDKSLFTPVPIFVDGDGNFILIKPELLYRPEIRDFYPPAAYQRGDFKVYSESMSLNEVEQTAMIAHIGERIYPHQFKALFDFAFLALHGPGGEDGSLQGLLEWYGIPYNGPDVQSSGVSMDKIYQNYLIAQTIGLDKRTAVIQKDELASTSIVQLFERAKAQVGIPFVVKAPHQGSSIGVAFVKQDNLKVFEEALKQCLFIKEIDTQVWQNLGKAEKVTLLQKMVNVSEGLAFPVTFGGQIIKHPQTLLEALDQYTTQHTGTMVITSVNTEDAVLLEAFVHGQEFSCGVIQTPDGQAVALPPTEIGKPNEDIDFDFETKYKKNVVRKYIPIRTSLENNQKVQKMVEDCFVSLKFGTVTRIDGFLTPDGTVILHDPNTIPGMSPTSLIFKQMAEIGLNVCDALTYFIRQSIRERIRTGKNAVVLALLLNDLDAKIATRVATLSQRKREEIRFEANDEAYTQAKQTYGKIAASAEAIPVPILLTEGSEHILPTNLMFKESIADVQALLSTETHPLIAETRRKAEAVTKQYTVHSGNV